MRIRKREKIAPTYISKYDDVTVVWTDEKGVAHTLVKDKPGRDMVVDEVVIFDVAEEFGWTDGIGGALGKTPQEGRE